MVAQQSAGPGSVPSIHMVGHITGNASFRGPEAFRQVHTWCVYTHAGTTLHLKNKIKPTRKLECILGGPHGLNTDKHGFYNYFTWMNVAPGRSPLETWQKKLLTQVKKLFSTVGKNF